MDDTSELMLALLRESAERGDLMGVGTVGAGDSRMPCVWVKTDDALVIGYVWRSAGEWKTTWIPAEEAERSGPQFDGKQWRPLSLRRRYWVHPGHQRRWRLPEAAAQAVALHRHERRARMYLGLGLMVSSVSLSLMWWMASQDPNAAQALLGGSSLLLAGVALLSLRSLLRVRRWLTPYLIGAPVELRTRQYNAPVVTLLLALMLAFLSVMAGVTFRGEVEQLLGVLVVSGLMFLPLPFLIRPVSLLEYAELDMAYLRAAQLPVRFDRVRSEASLG